MKQISAEQWRDVIAKWERSDEQHGITASTFELREQEKTWWQRDGWKQAPRVCDLPDEDDTGEWTW